MDLFIYIYIYYKLSSQKLIMVTKDWEEKENIGVFYVLFPDLVSSIKFRINSLRTNFINDFFVHSTFKYPILVCYNINCKVKCLIDAILTLSDNIGFMGSFARTNILEAYFVIQC